MKLEVLIASMDANPITLAEHMNIRTDAVICNQCHEFAYRDFERRGHEIRCWSFDERGVGRNRNNALMRARGDLLLFGDEDIVYEDDYEAKVLREFDRHPEADIILFNVTAAPGRETYENTRYKRVRWYNCGRYPAYAMCCRRESLLRANLWFSLLFGGGARYSNGEDSLFLHDGLQKGLRMIAAPVLLGHEIPRENNESTWFHGYTEKFFNDRGVLYYYLYGRLARLLAFRFLWAHRQEMCQDIPLRQAYAIMAQGIDSQKRPNPAEQD